MSCPFNNNKRFIQPISQQLTQLLHLLPRNPRITIPPKHRNLTPHIPIQTPLKHLSNIPIISLRNLPHKTLLRFLTPHPRPNKHLFPLLPQTSGPHTRAPHYSPHNSLVHMSRQLRKYAVLFARKFVEPIAPGQHDVRVEQHQTRELTAVQQLRAQRYRACDVVG